MGVQQLFVAMRAMQYIKNREELEDSLCCFCFEVNYELLRCRGPCQKQFCKRCTKLLNYSCNCPYCHQTLRPQYLPLKPVSFSCPSSHCKAELASQREFDLHCRSCLSLPEEERAEFMRRTTYRCPKDHPLSFPLIRKKCTDCTNYNYCSQCNTCKTYHCTECVRVPVSKGQCPLGHQLVTAKDGGSITCDLCAISPRHIQDTRIYSDRRCNFDVCQACWIKLPEQHPLPSYRTVPQAEEEEENIGRYF